MTWLDPPGLVPADIRARLFTLSLRGGRSPAPDTILFRSRWQCSRKCRLGLPKALQPGWTALIELEGHVHETRLGEGKESRTSLKHIAPCGAQILVS